MKQATRISGGLLAMLMASMLVVGYSGSAAYADDAISANEAPAVVGVDSEGNPIYKTSGVELKDPEETVPVEAPFPIQKDIELAPPPDQHSCTPKTTVKVKNLPNDLDVDWADSVINRKNNKVKFTVKAEIAKTFKWHLSGSISGEFQALVFSKVSVTINGGIENTKTTTYGSTIEVEVAPNDKTYTDRGMWQEKFSYTYTSTLRNCLKKSGSGTGQAPYRQAWHIY